MNHIEEPRGPEGMPLVLQSLLSVAYAALAPDGRVLAANDGFYLALRQPAGTAIADVSPLFANPRFGDLAARLATAENGQVIHRGFITFLDPTGGARSLQGTVYCRDDRLELVAEHDVQEQEGLFQMVMRLNEELAEQQRAVVRVNRELMREKDEQAALLERLANAQNQLLQSEKMASIGQLAAGVAHEINNPIGFVSSNLESLGLYTEDLLSLVAQYEHWTDPLVLAHPEALAGMAAAKEEADLDYLRQDLPNLLQETREGIQRVKKIVQDLKDFSHVSEQEWQVADLHQGLDSTLNVVWHEIKYKARMVKEYGDIPLVECVISQINQVFMNLLVNAAHAIADSGVITLRTGRDGNRVWVEVADTGAGIAPESLKRIFEPFYTTKPIGQGTGLGLSVSYGIVKKHGGQIEVESEIGKGSVFRIRLPVRQETAPSGAG